MIGLNNKKFSYFYNYKCKQIILFLYLKVMYLVSDSHSNASKQIKFNRLIKIIKSGITSKSQNESVKCSEITRESGKITRESGKITGGSGEIAR